MRTRAVVLLAVTVALLSYSAESWGGTMDTFGASSRGTAMGGAMISISNGAESVYYNPSALALSPNSTSVEVSNVGGELMINDENRLSGGVQLKVGLSHRFLRDRLGVGLLVGTGAGGLNLDMGSVLGSVTGGGGTPNWNWQMYGDSMPLLLSVGFGIRITDWLSVGVSGGQKDSLVSMSYYPVMVDPLLNELIGISTGFMPTNVHSMAFSAGADPSSDLNWGYNVTFRPIKYLSFGYMYKPEAWSRYKLRVELVGGTGSILSTSQYYLIDMQVPGQVETTVYGVAGHIPVVINDGTLTLSWAHEEQNWSGFYPRSVMYNWSGDDQFGKEWFTLKEARDPGLEDVAFDRFGFEYDGDGSPLVFNRLDNARFYVRGGYYHWNTPQPDANHTWQVAMVDSDADIYSFGLGLAFDRRGRKMANDPASNPRVQVDVHFQMINHEDRDYIMQPDKYGNVPFDFYDVETSASLTQYGVQVTWWR